MNEPFKEDGEGVTKEPLRLVSNNDAPTTPASKTIFRSSGNDGGGGMSTDLSDLKKDVDWLKKLFFWASPIAFAITISAIGGIWFFVWGIDKRIDEQSLTLNSAISENLVTLKINETKISGIEEDLKTVKSDLGSIENKIDEQNEMIRTVLNDIN